MRFESFEDLCYDVRESGGLLKVNMECLRDLAGAGKLGAQVREAIKAELEQHGLGSLPAELPRYQTDAVRVYDLSSPLGQIVDAVLKPSDIGDQALLQLNETAAMTLPPGAIALTRKAQQAVETALEQIRAAVWR